MLHRRLIPVFLLRGDRLVKGTRFSNHVDVGDPLSQAMIYDAQGADELVVVDIGATSMGRVIPASVIESMIRRCRLPIAAGGGIRSIEDARSVFHAGADKLVVNSAAIARPGLVRELADEFGAQSVVVSIDVRREPDGTYRVYARSGTQRVETGLHALVDRLVSEGAGELMVTCIDREGTLGGLDVDLYRSLRPEVPVPLIASGGVGTYDHFVELFEQSDCDACGIGKMLFLRDYDMVRIKAYLHGRHVDVREA